MANNPRLIEMADMRIGMWTVIRQSGNTTGGGALWLCRCDCGTERPVLGSDLRKRKSLCCGCVGQQRLGNFQRKHGKAGTRLYHIWKLMRARCRNPKSTKYYTYGARGIDVCKEWDDFSTFQTWAHSAGYADKLTIERVDVDKGYAPSNCTWIPANQQAINRRNTYRAPDGELWSHKAKRNGVSGSAFRRRMFDGWTPKEAATTPLGTRRIPRERDEVGRFC